MRQIGVFINQTSLKSKQNFSLLNELRTLMAIIFVRIWAPCRKVQNHLHRRRRRRPGVHQGLDHALPVHGPPAHGVGAVPLRRLRLRSSEVRVLLRLRPPGLQTLLLPPLPRAQMPALRLARGGLALLPELPREHALRRGKAEEEQVRTQSCDFSISCHVALAVVKMVL